MSYRYNKFFFMKPLGILFFFFVSFGAGAQEIKLLNLRCEYRVNPIGIGTALPKLSWELASSKRGVVQSAYRILVAEDSVSLVKGVGLVWDSKKVESDVSIGEVYKGPALVARRSYCWKVMVWDEASERQFEVESYRVLADGAFNGGGLEGGALDRVWGYIGTAIVPEGVCGREAVAAGHCFYQWAGAF